MEGGSQTFWITLVQAFSIYVLHSNPVDIEVSCYSYEGIDAVKKGLKKGMALSTVDMPVKVSAIDVVYAVFL